MFKTFMCTHALQVQDSVPLIVQAGENAHKSISEQNYLNVKRTEIHETTSV